MLTFNSEFVIVHKNNRVIHTHPYKTRPEVNGYIYYHGADFGTDKYDETESNKITTKDWKFCSMNHKDKVTLKAKDWSDSVIADV